MNDDDRAKQSARIEGLWSKLDPTHQGSVDRAALKEGLKRIDHRQFLIVLVQTLLSSIHSTSKCGRNYYGYYEGV